MIMVDDLYPHPLFLPNPTLSFSLTLNLNRTVTLTLNLYFSLTLNLNLKWAKGHNYVDELYPTPSFSSP